MADGSAAHGTTATPADLRARAGAILAGLTVEECLSLVSGRDFWSTQGIPGVVPSMTVTDGPHGLRKQAGDPDHVGLADSVPATCFPVAAVLAATWDEDLLTEVGRALGRECVAQDVALLLGPGLNLKRHPRGGRTFEYYSEDPVLSGYLAAALVEGVQAEGVGACLKHFAANNQETMRMVVDEIIDERTLREVYLRGFEIAIERSRPAAVMAAYNRINGTYCGDSSWLLREVLRDEWRFSGLVVSDWGATNDRVAALRAGMDLEMPGNGGAWSPEVRSALASGALAESDLRESAARVVALALRGAALRDRPAAEVDWAAHHALARRAAAVGSVLLSNDGLLPLAGTEGLAIIGAFAEVPRYQGAGSSRVNPTRVDTLRKALGRDVMFAAGYDPATGTSTVGQRAEAVRIAAGARAVVLVVGLPARSEMESRDRPTAGLPEGIERLVDEVCAANPRTAVVTMSGGALEMGWADAPAAVLVAGLAGQAGGSALADVLLGRTEPGGRLAEGIPVGMAQLPADANFPGLPRQVQYREGPWIGYRFHESWGVPARFPFGHGLGYTTWELGDLAVTGSGTAWTAEATVRNTGPRAGSCVVQVYVGAQQSPVPRPAAELAGFARMQVPAGGSARVAVPLERRVFTVWDVATGRWAVDGGHYEVGVGISSVEIHARAVIDVASDDTVTPVPWTDGPVATDAEFATLLGRPIPEPEGPRPFRRTSTVADLSDSRLGAVLASLMRRQMDRMVPADDDGTMRDMLEEVITGLPLRGLATLGRGLSPALLDRIIAVLNHEWRRALRGR